MSISSRFSYTTCGTGTSTICSSSASSCAKDRLLRRCLFSPPSLPIRRGFRPPTPNFMPASSPSGRRQLGRLQALLKAMCHLREVATCEGSIARANVRISRAVLILTSFIQCRSRKMLFRYVSIRAESSDVRLSSCLPKNVEISASPCPNNALGFSRATFSTRFVQVEEEPLRKTEKSESLSVPDQLAATKRFERALVDFLDNAAFKSRTRSWSFEPRRDGRGQATTPRSVSTKGFTARILAQSSTMLPGHGCRLRLDALENTRPLPCPSWR